MFAPDQVRALTDLEQIKILADPLRIRLIEAFYQERTTKQVAAVLDEKPTKLYHHVDALERVGLIRLTRTRQNRGTLEKYYVAVARTFRADASMFTPGESGEVDHGAIPELISLVLDRTGRELGELLAGNPGSLEEEGLFSHCEIRSDAEGIQRIRTKLEEVLKSLGPDSETDLPEAEQFRFRMTLALYPLPPETPATPDDDES